MAHLRCGLAVFALLTVVVGDAGSAPERPTGSAVTGPAPDPRLASQVGICPTDADLARLYSVEGKSQSVVLKTLGHPTHVLTRPDGAQVWQYPLATTCEVYIKDGRCYRTFYTGGY